MFSDNESRILHPQQEILRVDYDERTSQIFSVVSENCENVVNVELIEYGSDWLVRLNLDFVKSYDDFRRMESIAGCVVGWTKDVTVLHFADGYQREIANCTPSMIALVMNTIAEYIGYFTTADVISTYSYEPTAGMVDSTAEKNDDSHTFRDYTPSIATQQPVATKRKKNSWLRRSLSRKKKSS